MGVKYSWLYSHLITSKITTLHYETLVSSAIVVQNKMEKGPPLISNTLKCNLKFKD